MSTIADDASPLAPDDAGVPSPKGPWAFLGAALPGGLGSWGLQLMAGWLCFHVLTSVLWAQHMRSLAGWSGLPNYWGEMLSVRDVWEMAENGGMKNHATGMWAPLAALLSMAWFLWAGWQVQARAAKVPARFMAWFWSFADALLIAAIPLGLVGWLVLGSLEKMAETGIQGLGWLDWVGGTLVRFALVSTFFLQVWLCRLGRTQACGWRLGGWRKLARHLRLSFLRLWVHPIQWTVLVIAGVAVRAGLPFLVLFLGWRMGGGSTGRVWSLLGLQALAVLANAWLIGWFLRVTALFWRNDTAVQDVIQDLEARTAER